MTETTEDLMRRLHGTARSPALGDHLQADHDPIDRIRQDRTVPVFVREGYDSLFVILCKALHQAQDGKGQERHANGKPFDKQPIMTITDLVGMGFQTGQAVKKTVEAHDMVNRKQYAEAERELLGAINFLAAAVLQVNQLSTAHIKEN